MADIVASVGWSEHTDALLAGTEAAEQALRRLLPLKPKLAVVFGSSWFNQATLLQGVRALLGSLPLVGESTAGEIGPSGPSTRSCVILLIGGEALAHGIGCGEGVDRMPRQAGQQAAYAALRDFHSPRAGMLLFGDGLVTRYTEVLRGIQEALGTSALIIGGLAGDDFRYTRTYQYHQQRVLTGAVVSVLFGGGAKVGVGVEHGFAPISKPRRVTRAQANILYELDEQPAASVYEEYLGPELVQQMRQEGLLRRGIAYPLGMQSESSSEWLLRNVLAFGPDGSLSCTGDVIEGSWLQLMIGNRELALGAARKAAEQAVRSLDRVGCVIVFDSAIRRRLLGSEYAAREIAQVRDIVGQSTPLAGCYTYGELTPYGASPNGERTAIQTGSVLVIALGT